MGRDSVGEPSNMLFRTNPKLGLRFHTAYLIRVSSDQRYVASTSCQAFNDHGSRPHRTPCYKLINIDNFSKIFLVSYSPSNQARSLRSYLSFSFASHLLYFPSSLFLSPEPFFSVVTASGVTSCPACAFCVHAPLEHPQSVAASGI